ncbi:galactose-3-O-sulfotransferase 2-like [Branchiostoma lanceolatum]|uniref:galactose-3-O-sulfotransferase 2-like n=1 Tax=Branchiostoma lanceolatum TaxID=7740 RepID=UPI0034519BD6
MQRRAMIIISCLTFAVGLGMLFLGYDDLPVKKPVSAYHGRHMGTLQASEHITPESYRAEKQPTVIPRHIQENVSGSCVPWETFVFTKGHKTGSTTLVNTFQRYTIYHNLTVLMPVGRGPLSWPFPPREDEYVHVPGERYDAQLHHFVYNKQWLRDKFPPDTPYFSIIREPFSHLKSQFNYYDLPGLLGIKKSQNPLKTFLKDPWKYQVKSEVFFPHVNVTWDGSRNPMSFDLGWPADKAEKEEEARAYITQLEADFKLVLILEHLDESAVLLRRLMCWKIQDVVYYLKKKNEREYTFKKYVPTPEELANHQRWSAVDYMLYETFNKSLWRKIEAQSSDFYDELEYFKRINEEISSHCTRTMEEHKKKTKHKKRQRKKETLVMPASKWSPEFVVDYTFCFYITPKKTITLDVVMRGGRKYTKEEMSYAIVGITENLQRIRKGLPTYNSKHDARVAGIKI